MVPKRYLPVFVLLVGCFALWGLLNNMTDNLVPAFQRIFGTSQSTAGFVQISFYGAYSVVALAASFLIQRAGYRVGVLAGLGVYCVGAKLHWLDEVDGHAYAGKDSTERLAALLKELKPRAVIMHWPICDHPDHVMSYAAGMKALHLAGLFHSTEVYFHFQQSQNRNFQPRIYVDVTKVMDERNRLIKMYECQDGARLADYKEQVGRVFGKMTGYSAECLEMYSLMSGTCGPGRCIFDKLPRTSY